MSSSPAAPIANQGRPAPSPHPAPAVEPVSPRGWAIRVAGVSKCYEIYEKPIDRLKQTLLRGRRRYYREFWALRDISFEVGVGEGVGIVGRNGSGKSTLLQVIAGTLRPTEGEVHVRGRVAALLELGSGFNPEFTGRENVFLNGAILGLSQREIEQRFDEIASFADIGEFLERPVKTYSTGMVVRLAFAVQVQLSPDVLIVDEALAVGDALFQKRCFQKMEELRSRGVTLLFVSHDAESVRTLTSRAVLLEEGRSRAIGSSAEVLLEYRRLQHEAEKLYFDRVIARRTAAPRPAMESRGDGNRPTESVLPASAASVAEPVLRRSDSYSFGDMDAVIERVEVLGPDQQPTTLVYPGEHMTIRMQVRILKDLNHLNFGVRLRNREGVKVHSWGTLNQDISTWSGRSSAPVVWERTFSAGARVAVDLRCECGLGQNFYEVQAYVTQEHDRYFQAQRTLHWMDEAAFFQVQIRQTEYFFGGVCDLRMTAHVQD